MKVDGVPTSATGILGLRPFALLNDDLARRTAEPGRVVGSGVLSLLFALIFLSLRSVESARLAHEGGI